MQRQYLAGRRHKRFPEDHLKSLGVLPVPLRQRAAVKPVHFFEKAFSDPVGGGGSDARADAQQDLRLMGRFLFNKLVIARRSAETLRESLLQYMHDVGTDQSDSLTRHFPVAVNAADL